ncbi:MAG: ATP-binding protein [Proteobacteria bacterium]|nr:ATP-binding protein [Pseudomonadota bacterium]
MDRAPDRLYGELESIRKDGSTVWSESTMSIILDTQRRPTEVVGVSRDVTARRQVQEQQKRFLAMVSHEFRTPMNAILGISDLLADTELSAEQRKYLEVFQNAGNTLLDLINDILDLSKVEAGQFRLYPEDFALAPLLQGQLELLAGRAHDKGLELRLEIAAAAPAYVHGDAQRLKQCITNLVGNAVKFCSAGSITIAVDRQANAPGMLHFSVTDTGIGIPADKLDTIFEAFNQADGGITRNFGGTGLGLTITQRLVELMDGRIWVESTPGKGSVFQFFARLPDAPPVAAAAKPAPGAAQQQALTRPLSILLAEDNQNNVFLMRSLLKHTPCQIDLADNGSIAVDKFRAGHYDLILMDMEMPIMDGYSATREIRRIEQLEGRTPTPVIALTAHALQEDEQKSLNAGCNRHLTKPIRKQVLLDALRTLPLGTQQEPAAAAPPLPAPAGGAAEQLIAALGNDDLMDLAAAQGRLEVEPELFLTVLCLFRDALPGYRSGIAQMMSAGDFMEARRQAHSLKGEASTMGAATLSAAAASLEKALKTGQSEHYAALWEQLVPLIDAVQLSLARLPPGTN